MTNHEVSGRTLTPGGAPLASVELVISRYNWSGGWTEGIQVVSDDDGRWAARLEPGVVAITNIGPQPDYLVGYYGADAPGHFTTDPSAQTRISLNADVTGIEIRVGMRARFRGTVVDPAGRPVAGIQVMIVDESMYPVSREVRTTGAEGSFDAVAFEGHHYSVEFTDPAGSFVNGWYTDDATGFTGVESLRAVVTGAATGSIRINVQLPRPRTLTGTIRNRLGDPVSNVEVTATLREGWHGQYVRTDEDGAFALTLLGGRDFRFRITPPGLTYLAGWLGAGAIVATQDEAAWTHLEDADRTGFDVVLPPIPTISGRLTGPAGEALAGLEVRTDSGTYGSEPAAVTDADGRYAAPLQPGTYQPRFHDPANRYADAAWNSRGYQLDGTAEEVVVGIDGVRGIDMTVPRRVSLSGTLRDQAGTPVSDVPVRLNGQEPPAVTDGTGRWSFTINPARVWIEIAPSERHFGGYYETSGVVTARADATVIDAIGRDFAGLDSVLTPYPRVTGRLTNAGGDPVAGLAVGLYRPGDDDISPMSQATTDGDGDFTLYAHDGAGAYRLGSFADGVYARGWYTAAGWVRRRDAAEQISVGTTDVTGISMKAPAFGIVRARVRDAASEPPAGLRLVVQELRYGSHVASETFGPDGTAMIRFSTGSLDDLDNQFAFGVAGDGWWPSWWLQGALDDIIGSGAAFSVDYDQVIEVTGIARREITVTGRLLGTDGTPVSSALIGAYRDGMQMLRAQVNDGAFQMKLPGGAYTFADCTWDGDPTGLWWGATGSGMVNAAVDPFTSEFDDLSLTLRYTNHATVSGRVMRRDGRGVSGVEVDFFLYDGRYGSVKTRSNGTWSMHLPPGRYLVGYADPKGRYAMGWYSTRGYRLDESAASWVDITDSRRTGIDVRLPSTRTVSGTVVGPSRSLSPYVFVEAFVNGVYNGGAYARTGGSFSLKVAPGRVRLWVFDAAAKRAPGWATTTGLAVRFSSGRVIDVTRRNRSGITIRMPPAAYLTGRLRYDWYTTPEAWEDYWVSSVAHGETTSFGLTTETGSYRIPVLPGRYRLWADDHLLEDAGWTQRPIGWLRGTTATADPALASVITVRAGATVPRKWTLPEGALLNGRIGTERHALTGFRISVVSGGVFYRGGRATRDGSWSIRALPGTYRVAVIDEFHLYNSGWWNETAPGWLVTEYAAASDLVLDESGLDYGLPTHHVLRTPPSAPTAVRATALNAGAAIGWTRPSSDGGGPILRYVATASPGGRWCVVATPATTCTVTGLANGTAYTFSVRAVSTSGFGPASAPSAPVTPAAP